MLAERGYAAPWDYAYSDHAIDLPLQEAGVQRCIINPPSESKRVRVRRRRC